MTRLLRRAYFAVVYAVSGLLFGGVGLLLNVACMPLLLLPRRAALGPAVRRWIRRTFAAWLQWLHASGAVRVAWEGFESPLERGTVYVANHPSLIDATLLLARLPDAVCIFKPRLMRNPVIGPAAIMAGYVPGDAGVDLLRQAAEAVAAGRSLLIFPEGTRTTTGAVLDPLKGGFALIARRARAPVQLLVLRGPRGFLARDFPWWRTPGALPATYRITRDRRWAPDETRHAADLTAAIERRLRELLAP